MIGLIRETAEKYLSYNIDTTKGQSGSGVLIKLSKEEYILVGIHIGNIISSREGGEIVKRTNNKGSE